MSADDLSSTEKRWDASRYDDAYSFVWKHGAGVMELLAPQAAERILDLGCGTGHLTAQIAARGAEVVGIDRSPEMIATAQQNYPRLRFEVADAERFRFDEPFDAVFSNAAIHWMKDQPSVAASIWRALKPGGRFVAEFGGRDNIRSIETALRRAIRASGYAVSDEPYYYFPTVGEYASLLESAGFTVRLALRFERPTPLEGGAAGLSDWLVVFTDHFMKEIPADQRGRIMQAVEDELRPEFFRDGTWYADYCRLRVAASRGIYNPRGER
ncbi:MAG TPA: methyltransferase domain-containing protein [Blastocatellia bacterium]|nr:methyltransferase domain-containing protein [Blastocatellia bacterium]